MTSYVIRGGAEGKARLSVVSAALAPSTAAVLDAAGLGEGMRCLDRGCGGGDVTLAIGRAVGPGGSVVGIDMDAVKIELARQDAADADLGQVEFRTGDATTFDANGDFDLVYARLLLTHLREPDAVLLRMVAAVKPGGAVVVEDLDHSAVFSYPDCAALHLFVALYNEVARRRGGDPEIGPKLAGMFRRAGLDDIRLGVAQPVFMDGPEKRIHQLTLENVRDAMHAEGVATPQEMEMLASALETFSSDTDTISSFPRIFQASGRRPG
jgi:ubiquinone/menaquinone biosynthesis C-methylase UbiE